MKQMNNEDKVTEFHHVMGQPVNTIFTPQLLALRVELIQEEFREFGAEISAVMTDLHRGRQPNRATQAALLKELADLQYVLSGFAVTFGLPLAEAFNRVHASNLSKLVDGQPMRREDGKVLKGPNYQPPKMEDLI